ncbi:MAG TPA: PD-(D/E)XK nuclease family protein, partial [Bacteroidota bacterium]|nr:PD-(D/E)XK nuclease family protein [Bacteroidota bacterium]
MSNALLLSPGIDIIAAVADRIDRAGADCSHNLVLFPGKRPGHFLRKALAEKIGTSFLPPEIYSLDVFVETVFQTELDPGQTIRVLAPLDAASLLHDIHLQSPARLGAAYYLALDDFLPLGVKLFHELEEIAMEELPLAAVKEKTGAIEFRGLQPLYYFYDRFYAVLQEQGYCTPSVMHRRVADGLTKLDLSRYSNVLLAGFSSLTEVERRIFKALFKLPHATAIFSDGPGIDRHLRDLGIKPERVNGVQTAPRFHFYRAPDAHGEVLALNTLIEERKVSGKPFDEKSVIVLPAAETLFPLIEQSLSGFGEDEYNISLGYPVSRTPVAAFLNCLLNVVATMHTDQFYAPSYFRFVLHPYVKNIKLGNRSDATRILFHTIEEHFAGETSLTFFSLSQLEEMKILADALERLKEIDPEITIEGLKAHLREIHERTIGQFLRFENVADLAQKAIDALTYVHDRSTARAHPYFRRYVETLMNALNEISHSLLAPKQFAQRQQYFLFLRRCLASVHVPFEGTPLNGLQVLGFLETRNLSFDTVYLLDMNDDRIPGAPQTDMLLPQKIREALGLPTNADHEESMAYYFSLLTSGATDVHSFYIHHPQKDRSRYLEQLLWQRQQIDRAEKTDSYIRTVGYNVSLTNALPEPIAKTAAVISHLKEYAYNATVLDRYLDCQLKFYYAHVLRLAERDEIAGDIEKSDIGTLVHSILKAYFQTKRNTLLKESALKFDDLERIIDKQFTEAFGDEPFGAKFLLKKQIKLQLRKFLEEYQIPAVQIGQATILELEKFVDEVKVGPYNL